MFGKDITERKKVEEELRKSLSEKEALLRELYHRTKNNMSLINAMLGIEAGYIDDSRLREAFEETQDRIRSMALVHEKLYDARDLSHVNMNEYIVSLMSVMMSEYGISPERVRFAPTMDDVFVLIDTAIPCGLILNELISNSLKYAFPSGRSGRIGVDLHRAPDGRIDLAVSDDGVGPPPGFDIKRDGRVGLQTVLVLAEKQLDAQVDFDTRQGFSCRMQFLDDQYEPRV